jgi:peptidyl-prolyl cis-trans isomerase A (cyclophilin A)
MKKVLLYISMLFLGCSHTKNKFPHIVISTNFGDIEAELYPEKAPKTVAAFLQYIDSGYYKNALFYRVILQEGLSPASNAGIIQGGIWQVGNNTHASIAGIPHETTKKSSLSHTDGTLSLARTGLGTASTEFFICIGDQTQYDFGNDGVGDKQGYAAFGKVTKGMNVARLIQQQSSIGDSFREKILIKNIEHE